MRARLTVDKEYLIAHLGEVRALVDTGSHVSFGHAVSVEIDGISHPLRPHAGPLTVEALRDLSGADFNCLLGTDILSKHPFTLDTRRGEMVFGELPAAGHTETAELFMGSPYLTVEVAGQQVPCILDTGANIAFLPGDISWPVPVSGEREDFDPMFGPFVTPIRRCAASVLGQELELEFGQLPEATQQLMDRTPARGLMGMELLNAGRLGFDLTRRVLAYAPWN